MSICDTSKILSERLEELIEKKQDKNYTLSIKKQAKQMNLPYPTFMKYKENKAECPISALVKIAKYYNVSTDYLLGLSPDPCTASDVVPIIKYTGLTRNSIDYVKENSKILNLLLEQPQFKEIIINIEKLKELSQEQHYSENWYPKFSIYQLIDDGIIPVDDKQNDEYLFDDAYKFVEREIDEILNTRKFECNGAPDVATDIIQDEKDLIEYKTQKYLIELFNSIATYSSDDLIYFKSKYIKAYNKMFKELQEEKEFLQEIKNNSRFSKYGKNFRIKIIKIYEIWLDYFKKEALDNTNHKSNKQ